MCTLLTINSAVVDSDPKKLAALERRIRADGKENPHGFCLMTVTKSGEYLRLQTKNVEAVIAIMETVEWDRLWLHSRWATQGEARLANIHGWNGRNVFVMHNGHIKNEVAAKFPVDSMSIADHIQKNGTKKTIEEFLSKENFANVFMIRPSMGDYAVYRSSHGALHTDGKGNYSTKSDDLLGINISVVGGCSVHKTVKEETARFMSRPIQSVAGYYDGFDSYYSRRGWGNE